MQFETKILKKLKVLFDLFLHSLGYFIKSNQDNFDFLRHQIRNMNGYKRRQRLQLNLTGDLRLLTRFDISLQEAGIHSFHRAAQ